jgi:hypothetical protein
MIRGIQKKERKVKSKKLDYLTDRNPFLVINLVGDKNGMG